VTITDAASDSSSGTRVTPLGTPVASKLAFTQRPSNGESGVALAPPVTVAVEDQFGNTFTGDSSSTVTLTLNGGTFAGGGNTATSPVSNGVATFSNLAVSAPGAYTLSASDGTLTGATSSSFAVQTPTQLVFTQQPAGGTVGVALSPPVAVTVEDANGSTVSGDSSTVTLTLNGGTFAGGGNTATAGAVNGVATFGGLVINSAGTYTLTASDGSLTGATSSSFTISAGTSIYDDFNSGAGSFTSNFTVNNNGGANSTSLAWGAGFGVQDQPGPTDGGGVQSSGGVAIDSTAIYTPSKVNLGDGQVHTLSEYVTAVAGLGTGDKSLQLGYLSALSAGFNAGFSFISARILGNDTVEFQYDNGTSPATSIDNTKPTGTIKTGDWLDLILSTQETASGSFKGTFALVDYGPGGVGAGTTVLAPVSWTVLGLTTLGTASAVAAGFRTATAATFTGHVNFDNFAVDPPPPAKLAYLQQPSVGTAGTPLGPFVVAVEDIAGHTVSTDASTVTLTLSHGTFANGTTSVSATAVDGVATFSNLVINAAGSYVLRATDTNPNLDPGYGPFTINGAAKLAFTQQPSNASAGAAISPPVTVAVEDVNGNTVPIDTSTVTLTLSSDTFAGGGNTVSAAAVNGVATFGNLVIDAGGTYTLAASDGSLTGATSGSFTITAQTVTTVDDAVQGTGMNQFHYVGKWTHVTGTTIPNAYGGTVSNDSTTNDTVTISFSGTQIKLYAAERNNRGIAAVSLDSGAETRVDMYAASSAGVGDVLVYTSPTLTAGTHTFKVRTTGTRDSKSSGTLVSIDRVDIIQGDPPVSLAGAFNQVGIVRDGSTFSGGLDGGGAALSANLLGAGLVWAGTQFALGAAGANNVVAAAGQTINLPAGSFSALKFLAAAVNGNQPNQTFVVTYTDGTTDTFSQGVSDWFTPQNYGVESDAVGMAYRDLSNGSRDARTFHVYGYSLSLRPGKAVRSLKLPKNGKVIILAVSLA
jgi:hypothetical protein